MPTVKFKKKRVLFRATPRVHETYRKYVKADFLFDYFFTYKYKFSFLYQLASIFYYKYFF